MVQKSRRTKSVSGNYPLCTNASLRNSGRTGWKSKSSRHSGGTRKGSGTAPEICHTLAVLLLKDTKNLNSNAFEIRTSLEKAAKADKPQPETLLLLASILQNGIGGSSDRKRAADLLETAARHQHPAAMVRYGKLLEHGFDRKANPVQAIELYRQAAEKGNPEGMFALAGHLKSGFYISADLAQAFKLFKASAEKGYPPAFAETGDCFRYGYGVEPSPEKAFNWYMRGARLNEPGAQFRAGDCYRLAIGIPEDPAGAVYWYQKAAKISSVQRKNSSRSSASIESKSGASPSLLL